MHSPILNVGGHFRERQVAQYKTFKFVHFNSDRVLSGLRIKVYSTGDGKEVKAMPDLNARQRRVALLDILSSGEKYTVPNLAFEFGVDE